MKTYSIGHNFIQLKFLQTNIHLPILDGKGEGNINSYFGQSLHTTYYVWVGLIICERLVLCSMYIVCKAQV